MSRQPEIVGLTTTFLVLTWAFVFLRFYVRGHLIHNVQISDYGLLLTQLFYTIFCILIFVGVSYGIGLHSWEVSLDEQVEGTYYAYIMQLFYVLACTTLRISIGLQLWAILPKKQSKSQTTLILQRATIIVTLSIIVIFSIVFFFLLIFQCSPVSFYWENVEGVEGTCLNIAVPYYIHAALSCSTDIILGSVPVWLLWKAKLNLKDKIAVMALLSMGVLAGIVSIIRIPYILIMVTQRDYLWDCVPIQLSSNIEPAIGILAACIASFKPLWTKITGKSFSPTTYASSPSRTQRTSEQQCNVSYSPKISGSSAPSSFTEDGARHEDFGPRIEIHSDDPERHLIGLQSVVQNPSPQRSYSSFAVHKKSEIEVYHE